MPVILALDQGTTSSRAIVFDTDGTPLATAQKEFRQHFPRPGWVEHDPEEIWATQLGTAVEALGRARVGLRDIAAIGITNQRETIVVWDRRTGEPLHNAIVWQDRRTSTMCDRLKREGLEDLIRERTGLLIDPYFSGTKLAWLLENVPGLRDKAEAGRACAGTVDSWLVYRLTGGADGGLHITDASNASRTLLYDIRRGDWDDELLRIFGVPRGMLPGVRASSEVYGATARTLPLGGARVAGILGDQQAALAGQACLHRGLAKNTYGTGCFMLTNTGRTPVVSGNRLLTTVAWRRGGETEYALEGSVFIGGAVVQWLRDGLGIIRSSAQVEPLALSVPDNGGVYLVPAFTGLGAPHWDPYARGMIVGITRGTTAGHIARAAIEGICYQIADLFDAMRTDAGVDIPELRVDGGAAANDSLLQFQSDVLQMPLVRPKSLETTALGTAYMAGLAVGFWKSTDDIERNWQADRRFEPRMPAEHAAELRSRWADAVERSKGWAAGEGA